MKKLFLLLAIVAFALAVPNSAKAQCSNVFIDSRSEAYDAENNQITSGKFCGPVNGLTVYFQVYDTSVTPWTSPTGIYTATKKNGTALPGTWDLSNANVNGSIQFIGDFVHADNVIIKITFTASSGCCISKEVWLSGNNIPEAYIEATPKCSGKNRFYIDNLNPTVLVPSKYWYDIGNGFVFGRQFNAPGGVAPLIKITSGWCETIILAPADYSNSPFKIDAIVNNGGILEANLSSNIVSANSSTFVWKWNGAVIGTGSNTASFMGPGWYKCSVKSVDGCTASLRILLDANGNELARLAGDGDEAESMISVYPNPAKDQITVKGVEWNEMITIFDAIGRKVASHNISPDLLTIDVSELQPGMYHVSGVSGFSKKFIKE